MDAKPLTELLPGLIYLATPYSDEDRAVRVARFAAVNRCAARLMGEGLSIYSPISHGHPITEAGQLPFYARFWQQQSALILASCSAVIVYCQDGWKTSVGVQAELALARELGLPILFLDP
jgi:hypothetical protein